MGPEGDKTTGQGGAWGRRRGRGFEAIPQGGGGCTPRPRIACGRRSVVDQAQKPLPQWDGGSFSLGSAGKSFMGKEAGLYGLLVPPANGLCAWRILPK